ncbi:unnamed protein product [Vitrella brassicaformis CCMP3155]|uniref:Uncharacterized protein n=1 Tax=Vitrella brassicaformis (strain CCMP3155) TaxID=1169540 RepID=A0A0G4F3M1_VITBC|nr:unnamed protein product [Vitrella brassicaformis CCMP3155]|eukprot:CEM06512.1 unnamed protein product [Vitrella brassicaformis CCMP3155]
MKLEIFLCVVGLAAVCGTASSNTNTTATAANPSAADATTNETSVSMPEADLDATPLDNSVADGEDGGSRRLQSDEQVFRETVSHEGVRRCDKSALIEKGEAIGRERAREWGGGWRLESVEVVGDPEPTTTRRSADTPSSCSISGTVEITLVTWKKIGVLNKCDEPLRIIVHYKPRSGDWVCSDWYSVSPDDDKGYFPFQVDGEWEIYWYAHTTVSGARWRGYGDDIKECEGEDLDMQVATLDEDLDYDGNFFLRLTCDRRLLRGRQLDR